MFRLLGYLGSWQDVYTSDLAPESVLQASHQDSKHAATGVCEIMLAKQTVKDGDRPRLLTLLAPAQPAWLAPMIATTLVNRVGKEIDALVFDDNVSSTPPAAAICSACKLIESVTKDAARLNGQTANATKTPVWVLVLSMALLISYGIYSHSHFASKSDVSRQDVSHLSQRLVDVETSLRNTQTARDEIIDKSKILAGLQDLENIALRRTVLESLWDKISRQTSTTVIRRDRIDLRSKTTQVDVPLHANISNVWFALMPEAKEAKEAKDVKAAALITQSEWISPDGTRLGATRNPNASAFAEVAPPKAAQGGNEETFSLEVSWEPANGRENATLLILVFPSSSK